MNTNTHTNTVHLVGNLGKDVQVTTFESGKKKAAFSLATNESYKNQKGEMVSNTTWHNIIAWGNVADGIANLVKGNKVDIRGSLSNNSYTDKDGQKRYITQVVALQISKLETTTNEVPMPSI
jgi:single-strand DNA-binding protein